MCYSTVSKSECHPILYMTNISSSAFLMVFLGFSFFFFLSFIISFTSQTPWPWIRPEVQRHEQSPHPKLPCLHTSLSKQTEKGGEVKANAQITPFFTITGKLLLKMFLESGSEQWARAVRKLHAQSWAQRVQQGRFSKWLANMLLIFQDLTQVWMVEVSGSYARSSIEESFWGVENSSDNKHSEINSILWATPTLYPWYPVQNLAHEECSVSSWMRWMQHST